MYEGEHGRNQSVADDGKEEIHCLENLKSITKQTKNLTVFCHDHVLAVPYKVSDTGWMKPSLRAQPLWSTTEQNDSPTEDFPAKQAS